MEKQNLLVLFGGQSSEHDISCLSAVNIIKAINRDRYHVILVGITTEGHWIYTDFVHQIEDGTWLLGNVSAVLSPDATKKSLYLLQPAGVETVSIDVVFPVLHGLYGEDGTIQGVLELARIPYVGCGVLSSAVCMDKATTKMLVDSLGIRQAKTVLIFRRELAEVEDCVLRIEKKLSYPVFVKPSSAGSSCGVTKANNKEELIEALYTAAYHDGKILVEETIVGRELECAAFGIEKDVIISDVGEILPAAEFYDFDAKYNSRESKTTVSPDLPAEVVKEIRKASRKIFRALGCFGLSRIDFFLDEKGIVFNEINTMPGFTAISMYPKLFEKMGVTNEQLVQDLIDIAFLRSEHEVREQNEE